jgi:hypothetical protein
VENNGGFLDKVGMREFRYLIRLLLESSGYRILELNSWKY